MEARTLPARLAVTRRTTLGAGDWLVCGCRRCVCRPGWSALGMPTALAEAGDQLSCVIQRGLTGRWNRRAASPPAAQRLCVSVTNDTARASRAAAGVSTGRTLDDGGSAHNTVWWHARRGLRQGRSFVPAGLVSSPGTRIRGIRSSLDALTIGLRPSLSELQTSSYWASRTDYRRNRPLRQLWNYYLERRGTLTSRFSSPRLALLASAAERGR